MEKSLYFSYAEKFFPALVSELIEKLNDKTAQELPYLFKGMLAPQYSADGRWASIKANYTRVAADIVALDSEIPLKSRDALTTYTGEIPKMAMKMYMTEKNMKDVDFMVAMNRPTGMVLNKIFADTPRCITGIWERIEDVFESMLTTGIGQATRDAGTGVRLNMGYSDSNKKGVAKKWSETDATPIDDINAVIDAGITDQNFITDVYIDQTALTQLKKNAQTREQYAFSANNVVGAGSTVPVLTNQQITALFEAQWGVALHIVNRKVKTELDGVKKNHTPWAAGKVVFTCDKVVGDLVWTDCAEATRPATGVIYQNADNYMLLSKYSTVDPLREFTASQAMVVPILNNVDRIYTLETQTAQA